MTKSSSPSTPRAFALATEITGTSAPDTIASRMTLCSASVGISSPSRYFSRSSSSAEIADSIMV